MWIEGISKDPTGNRTGNLPSCGVVPQPTAPQLADKAGTGWKGISSCDVSSVHCVRDVSWSCHRLTCQIINITCRVKKAFQLKFGRYQVVTTARDRQPCNTIMQYILFANSHPWNRRRRMQQNPCVLMILPFPFSHPTRKPVVNVLDGVLYFLLVNVRSSFNRRACFNVRCEL